MSKYELQNFFSKNRKSYWWRHFFGLGLGLGLELCWSRSRSQNWDRDRSWSRKNFAVSVSVLVSDESVSTTALSATLPKYIPMLGKLMRNFKVNLLRIFKQFFNSIKV